MNTKARFGWMVNLALAFCFLLLALTGLLSWMIPHGRGNPGTAQDIRHFFQDVHGVTGLVFLCTLLLHLWLHWPYIRRNLKDMGWWS